MNALRPLALILVLSLPWYSGGVVHAAQPPTKEQAQQGKAAKPVSKVVAKPAAKAPAKAAVKPKPKQKPVTRSKGVNKVASQPVPAAKLDLSLPTDMVKHLKPDVGNAPSIRKPLLPSMFSEKPVTNDSPFQLNGRLISNEMQLQLRNDSRRDVEGAAIEFEFRN
ncbi:MULTISPECIES: hypothetical protein [Pseudomonas]|uniref:hypothetical protein n=1 Tax=Pseudomonas TaxID=286 RepID=UPI001E6263C5|nr:MULTISPECIES: hypothetical protein [Pseudomonas]MCE1117022.1 hypothetical protein [Pseudomonas sp. NMI795_08]